MENKVLKRFITNHLKNGFSGFDARYRTRLLRTLSTIGDWLRYAVTYFESARLSYGQGTLDAWDEANQLVHSVLRLPYSASLPVDAHLCFGERFAIAQLIYQRVATRKPLAYLTGEAWLGGLKFVSDSRAIVPRSLLVEILTKDFPPVWCEIVPQPITWPTSVLDLCTGGGSLAILAAHRFPNAKIFACDNSAAALSLAKENICLHRLSHQISLFEGDLFSALDQVFSMDSFETQTFFADPVKRENRFDLILCNPPYVNDASIKALPAEFKVEPLSALAGGIDGMSVIRRIIDKVPDYLSPNGLFLLEIGWEASHFESAFPDVEFFYLPVSAGEQMVVLLPGLSKM